MNSLRFSLNLFFLLALFLKHSSCRTLARNDSSETLVKNSATKLFDSVLNLNQSIVDALSQELNNGTENALDKWLIYQRILSQINDAFLGSFASVMTGMTQLNISSPCFFSLTEFVSSFQRQETWAYRLLNSYGNAIDSGFLLGSLTQLGDFDQCLETRAKSTQGQYCLVKYRLNIGAAAQSSNFTSNITSSVYSHQDQRLKISDRYYNTTGTALEDTFIEEILRYSHIFDTKFGRMGICTTSQCTAQDVQLLIDYLFPSQDATFIVSDCQIEVKSYFTDMNTLQKCILFVFICIIINAIVCTVVTQLFKFNTKDHTDFGRIVANFCMVNNFQSLMKMDYSQDNLSSVNGVRLLTMFWIVYSHAYLLSMKESFHEAIKLMNSVYNPNFYMVYNGWPSVENYFLISSLLLTHAFIQMKFTNKLVGPHIFIFHRLIRLWPNIFLIIGIIFLMPNIVQGPLWPDAVRMQIDNCYKYWWKIPLFISNFRAEDEYCHAHTWYLSADTQLYVVSLVLLFLWLRFKSVILYLIGAIIPITAIIISIVFYVYRLQPTILFDNLDELLIYRDMLIIYMPTYYHITPCLIGMLTGYFLINAREKKFRLNYKLNVALWFFSFVTMFVVLWSGYLFVRYPDSPIFIKSFYAGFYRLFWSLALAFILFSCELGQGGIFGKFLSHPAFVPLSKLNYLVYLLHFIVTWARADSIRTPLVFSNFTMLNEFIINLTWSYFLAAICYILIESPILKHQKMILSYLMKHRQNSPPSIELDEISQDLDYSSSEPSSYHEKKAPSFVIQNRIFSSFPPPPPPSLPAKRSPSRSSISYSSDSDSDTTNCPSSLPQLVPFDPSKISFSSNLDSSSFPIQTNPPSIQSRITSFSALCSKPAVEKMFSQDIFKD